jgi:hypothetical protein
MGGCRSPLSGRCTREAHRALLYLPPVLTRGVRALTTTGLHASLSRTHPQSRATLEQQVHSKVSLRRAVDAV